MILIKRNLNYKDGNKKEKVLEVKHYTDNLMHFKTTRDPGTRFRDGEFLMIGLDNWSEKLQKNKPIMRAYSIASPNYEEYMEFLSVKVPDGPLIVDCNI